MYNYSLQSCNHYSERRTRELTANLELFLMFRRGRRRLLQKSSELVVLTVNALLFVHMSCVVVLCEIKYITIDFVFWFQIWNNGNSDWWCRMKGYPLNRTCPKMKCIVARMFCIGNRGGLFQICWPTTSIDLPSSVARRVDDLTRGPLVADLSMNLCSASERQV